MLFAVEGGGFFSSSASGYSKGLALLLLGQKNEEKPMRVTPWNQYQLVDQEKTDSNTPLASAKNRVIRGCASFVCFGSATAGLESPSPLKVGPTQHQEIFPEVSLTSKDEDQISSNVDIVGDEISVKRISIKSSLRKSKKSVPISRGSDEEREALCEKGSEVGVQMERRKVQWTDTAGGELVEIREFEPSDNGESDDEFDDGRERTCSCTIM